MTEQSIELPIMQLKIQLRDVKPATWRRVLVPTTIRYDQLHVIIQLLFDWENAHLHGFTVAHDRLLNYVPATDADEGFGGLQYRLTQDYLVYPDLALGRITYTYDYGDSWEHVITLEKMLAVSDLTTAQLPLCTAGRGAARMEDSRGATEDGFGETGLPFDQGDINEALAAYAEAGAQLINGIDF